MRVASVVLVVALIAPCAPLSAEECAPPPAKPLHWSYAVGTGPVLVTVDRDDCSGRFAVVVADTHVYQEYEFTIPRYGDDRTYRHHVWEVWARPPRVARTRLGVRDIDTPRRYHRIAFAVATRLGDVPQWLEVREGSAGVLIEVTTLLP